MKLRYILSLLLVVAVVYSLSAQTEKADAEYLSLKKVYVLNADGSWDYHYSHQLKYHTHYAFHRLHGESFVVYNPDFQSLKIKKSETTMADGTKVASPDNAFNKVLPSFAANSPTYNHLVEMVITHTGLEVGSIVDLEYSIHTKKGFWPALMGDEVFGSFAPINNMEVEVHVPAGTKLNYTFMNMRLGPEIIEKGKTTIYKWKAKGLKMLSHEILTGDYNDQYPRLLFGTDDLYRCLDRFVNQEAFKSKMGGIRNAQVDDLKKKSDTEMDLLKAIQKILVRDMNTYNIPDKYLGFKARSIDKTYKSNGGTPLEKTLLLSALYQSAGFATEVVAMVPKQYFKLEQGNILNINGYAVRVTTKENNTVYMSAVKAHNRSVDKIYSDYVFVDLNPYLESVKKKETKSLKVISSLKAEIEWEKDGEIEIEGSLRRVGQIIPYFTYKSDRSKVINELKRINKKAIETFNVTTIRPEVVAANFEIEGDHLYHEIESYKVLNLPKLQDLVDEWRIPFLESNRESTIILPATIEQNYEYKIELPEGSRLITEEIHIQESNRIGSLNMMIKKTDDNELIIKHSLIIRETHIKAADVKELLILIKPWLNERHWQLILK